MYGWPILEHSTYSQFIAAEPAAAVGGGALAMGTGTYILVDISRDLETAYRTHMGREMRRERESIRTRLLRYLKLGPNAHITAEELRYVANDRTEWARRVRELRTEMGWPITTRFTGRPDLPVGVYVLAMDRQSPAHDRRIPDPVRCAVLERDRYACVDCGWTQEKWNSAAPRHLELHHRTHHVRGGENDERNLATLCNVCHDRRHRMEK
jgi:hypothetical protein